MRWAPLLLLLLAAVGTPARADALPPTRCASVEAPERPGRPHVLVPPGQVPHASPSQIAALAVGAAEDAPVPCLELLPPQHPDGPRSSIQSEPWWAVHVDAPFFKIVRGAHGSCRAAHQIVFVTDRTRSIVSSVGIGQECRMQPLQLHPGR